jgi:peroxiredoxin Q/BCP
MRLLERIGVAVLVASLGILAMSGSTFATQEDKPVDLKVGDAAPVFESIDDEGHAWKSKDYVGKRVLVVYFYPADFTGGCTKQACGFRDDMKPLESKGVTVLGVSGDSAKNHELFKKHHKLNFTLLADEKGELAKKFGVPTKPGGEVKVKELDDLIIKRGVTTARWTFVIGKDGKIAYKDTQVAAAEDSKKMLELIEKLNK